MDTKYSWLGCGGERSNKIEYLFFCFCGKYKNYLLNFVLSCCLSKMEIVMNLGVSSVDVSSGVEKIIKKRGRKPKQHEIHNTKIKTYHFNMSPEMIEAISYFANLHRFDDRKIFKEEWEKWIQDENIARLVELEIARLKTNGYSGNVLEKLFHSARYYYRKKPLGGGVEVVAGGDKGGEGGVKKRKKYETIGADVLQQMDDHIVKMVKSNIVDVMCVDGKTVLYSDISPCNAFKAFLEIVPVEKTMIAKYKKTYKNRFFICSRGR